MTRLELLGPMQVPPGGDLHLVAQVQTSESFELQLKLPEGVTLVEGQDYQLLSVDGPQQAEFPFRLQLTGPLRAPIRLRLTGASGAVEEEVYPPATLVVPTAGSRTLSILSLLVGAAGVGVAVIALVRNQGTRKELRARDESADEWLRGNYELWRGQERAAAKVKRKARRDKRRARREARRAEGAPALEQLEAQLSDGGEG